MTTKGINERLRAYEATNEGGAMTESSIENDQMRAAVKSGDWETFVRLETERTAARKAAMDRGFTTAGEGFYAADPSRAGR